MFRAPLALLLFVFTACSPAKVVHGAASLGRDGGDDADAGELADAGEVVDAGVVPDAGVDAGEAFDAGVVDAGLTAGAKDRLLLLGTIVTPLDVFEGQVLIEGALITCVSADGGCESLPGALGATRLDTDGVIAPGMIDTHNHILFDVFDDDDWTPSRLYGNHDQWTSEPGYQAMLQVKHCLANDSQGKPAWCGLTPYGTATGSLRCEMDKFGELKGLIAGTTSIVGLPGTSSGCFGSLARSIDSSANGLVGDKIRTSALFPPSSATAVTTCAGFADGSVDAFLVHCGEGIDVSALSEYATLSALAAGCLLAPQTTLTHATAFAPNEFTDMASHGVRLSWSPHSNISLYGATTNIPAARAAGVTVALGPDWSMGGSQNMLEELRFAQEWDQANWNGSLSARDLVVMATTNGAAVVGQSGHLGVLAPGALADVIVVRGDRLNPYQALIDATPREVALVMVGGVVQYGDARWRDVAASPGNCEALDVCSGPKFLCMAVPGGASKLDQTWGEVSTALNDAMLVSDAARDAGDGRTFAPLPPLVRCP
jgi:5-methylthioadenosine/S-adenosylhomocysteine deaminase